MFSIQEKSKETLAGVFCVLGIPYILNKGERKVQRYKTKKEKILFDPKTFKPILNEKIPEAPCIRYTLDFLGDDPKSKETYHKVTKEGEKENKELLPGFNPISHLLYKGIDCSVIFEDIKMASKKE